MIDLYPQFWSSSCRKHHSRPDESAQPIHRARWQVLGPSPFTLKSSSEAPCSFLVPKDEIAANDYDLSINRYKEIEYEAVAHEAPKVILERLAKLEDEINKGRKELEEMLG